MKLKKILEKHRKFLNAIADDHINGWKIHYNAETDRFEMRHELTIHTASVKFSVVKGVIKRTDNYFHTPEQAEEAEGVLNIYLNLDGDVKK